MTYISLPRTGRAPRKNLWSRIAMAYALMRQRRRLAQLDEAALTDIGVSREEAQAEARRPVWDAPQSWLR